MASILYSKLQTTYYSTSWDLHLRSYLAFFVDVHSKYFPGVELCGKTFFPIQAFGNDTADGYLTRNSYLLCNSPLYMTQPSVSQTSKGLNMGGHIWCATQNTHAQKNFLSHLAEGSCMVGHIKRGGGMHFIPHLKKYPPPFYDPPSGSWKPPRGHVRGGAYKGIFVN